VGVKPVATLAERLVGRRCYIGWPFLVEAQITSIADGLFTYRSGKGGSSSGSAGAAAGGGVVRQPMDAHEVATWPAHTEQLARVYARRGIVLNDVEAIVTVRPFKARAPTYPRTRTQAQQQAWWVVHT
jgi:5'-3' exoribonuclease 1